jgi:hypothetical protein
MFPVVFALGPSENSDHYDLIVSQATELIRTVLSYKTHDLAHAGDPHDFHQQVWVTSRTI